MTDSVASGSEGGEQLVRVEHRQPCPAKPRRVSRDDAGRPPGPRCLVDDGVLEVREAQVRCRGEHLAVDGSDREHLKQLPDQGASPLLPNCAAPHLTV
jgi:hypothetical protein